jgi:hypothetical protein
VGLSVEDENAIGGTGLPVDLHRALDQVTLDESITMAFLVVLESMTPAERVAFDLHDVFRYPFAEVAEIVVRTPAACRQLASSARRRIRACELPATAPARQTTIVRAFKAARETHLGRAHPRETPSLDDEIVQGHVSTAAEAILGSAQERPPIKGLTRAFSAISGGFQCPVSTSALRSNRVVGERRPDHAIDACLEEPR